MRHFVVVFNRPTEEVDKLYVESPEAGGAIETAREYYIKKGWEPTVLLCPAGSTQAANAASASPCGRKDCSKCPQSA